MINVNAIETLVHEEPILALLSDLLDMGCPPVCFIVVAEIQLFS